MANRIRLEISIAYQDKRGQKRYANQLGNLWLDTETMRGSIELPPGVCLSNPGDGAYLNVSVPREGANKGQREQAGGRGWEGGAEGAGAVDDDIPFSPLRGEV